MKQFLNNDASGAVERGDQLRTAGDLDGAIGAYLMAAAHTHPVPASLCLSLARTYFRANNVTEAIRWAVAVVDAGDDFSTWMSAASLIGNATNWKTGKPRRRSRVALVGSFTTLQLKAILPLAGLRHGIEFEMWEAPYGQYRQELLDPQSALYRSQPDFIVLAVHEGELTLPFLSQKPEDDVAQEIRRWTSLWEVAALTAQPASFNSTLPFQRKHRLGIWGRVCQARATR